MRLLTEIARGAVETVRETLPRTEDEAAAFTSGLCYAFAVHWILLIALTWGYCATRGTC